MLLLLPECRTINHMTTAPTERRGPGRPPAYGERKFFAVRLEMPVARKFMARADSADLKWGEYLAKLVMDDLAAGEQRDAA